MAASILTGKLTFQSLSPCDLSVCTKKEIRAYFENSYDLNESLFTSLNGEEAFYLRPDRLRLPLLFYYGHTACVYINKLILAGLLQSKDRVNLTFETMFETGVDEMSWDDVENYRMGGKLRWPALAEVVKYRGRVRKLILDLIEATPLQLPITQDSAWWGLFMGMEHERIHVETSSVLIRQLPVGFVHRPATWKYAPFHAESGAGCENKMVAVEACELTLGKPADFPSYGWDDEYGSLHCKVPQFEASRYLTSNREFAEFVRSGGYSEQGHWSAEGWQWKAYRQATHPTFWVCSQGCKSGCGGALSAFTKCKWTQPRTDGRDDCGDGDVKTDGCVHQGKDEGGGCLDISQYRLRLMFDVVDMPWDWPVEVNFHEAKAFCAWKGPGYRLPIEAEHSRMRGIGSTLPSNATDCDMILSRQPGVNLNLKHGSSTPVNMYGATADGLHDVCGNVWQWVEDHMNGLPGFQTMVYYDDFTLPTLDGRHNMIMGSSWVSTGDMVSRFARFAFRRHFFQHLGFRVVRTPPGDELVELPVCFIKTKIYVLVDGGGGVQENAPSIEASPATTYVATDTVNRQYCDDTPAAAQCMLATEYDGDDGRPTGAAQLARLCVRLVAERGIARGRAFHIGCATGRTTFTLADAFDEVIGQDCSAYFTETCLRIQQSCDMSRDEPAVSRDNEPAVSLDMPSLQHYISSISGGRSNLTFKQLTWLPNEVGFYDLILMTGLERLQNAKAWFLRLPEILLPGGLLVVAAPLQLEQLVLEELNKRFKLSQSVQIQVPVQTFVTVWQHQ